MNRSLRQAQRRRVTPASDFARIARDAQVTQGHPVLIDGKQTIMKLCARCDAMMPHALGAAHCALCEMEVEP